MTSRRPALAARVLSVATLFAVGAIASACGGHASTAGQASARAACQSGGATAASDAATAASQNSLYATLAADTKASAAAQGVVSNELSDGSTGGGSLITTQALGTPQGQKVLADCVSLGLNVTAH